MLPGAKVEWTNTRQGWHEELGGPMVQAWVTDKTGQRRRTELLVDVELRRGAAASVALNG